MKEKKSSIIYGNIFVLVLLCMCVTACRRQKQSDVELNSDQSAGEVAKEVEKVESSLSSPELRTLMQTRVGAFMDSDSPSERARLAAKTYTEMERELAGHAPAESDMTLVSLASGLIACAGDKPSQVVEALLTAAGPQRRGMVLAAIATVQKDVPASELCKVATTVFASKNVEHIQSVIDDPADFLEPEMLKSVTQSAAGFLLLKKARAAGETSMFADRDGGEQPASRNTDSTTKGDL